MLFEHEHKRRRKDEEALTNEEIESEGKHTGKEHSFLVGSTNPKSGNEKDGEEGEFQGHEVEVNGEKVLPFKKGEIGSSGMLDGVSEGPDLAGKAVSADKNDEEGK